VAVRSANKTNGDSMKKAAVLLALILLPAAAQAQFFVEGTFGGAKADLDDFEAQGFATDNTSGTWSLGGGFMFNRFLGIEAGYRAIGDAQIEPLGALPGTKSDARGLYVGPLFETFIDRFRLNARVGMFAWKSDITVSVAGASSETKDDGFDPYVGLGVSYAMTERAFFGLSWTRFRVLDELDTDAWEVRLKYSF